ncbi:Na+/H+ antiporter NhaA [Paractinoplanes lichenicola]|uniref:Na(+)/H(+) antiporter NhaA n=1 Tax=Paractinoplanes lichenicola TaxID=2802976 RepID=A0ABS1VSQ3_9ACTN|nr:Na+/H+ antiporter NhaA [Actinoplanes lichenicola]MBL7257266.1 Na+/H+ antiporter NhaA [Actinoplanes lichenicola]
MTRIAAALRSDTTAGFLLLGAAFTALVWANSPWSGGYHALANAELGLTVAKWASDGLLAIFFFVAGLELKRELVVGDLRDPRRATLPVAAAVGGMIVPALLYTVINLAAGGDGVRGWAIPTATDIAFALAVLAVVGRSLPPGLRLFLLTLAVVDDLLAIAVIAVFYTSTLHLVALLLAVLPIAAFGLLTQRGVRAWWALLPLAIAAWALMHESGVHATVAGVLLAFTVPVRGAALAEPFEHWWRPLSSGVAVPVFAFFAAGVTVGGDFGAALLDPVTIGIVAGLVLGKTIGITGATWLVQRFTGAELPRGVSWLDLLGLAMLGGIGFTVSLLIGELAFGAAPEPKVGVLLGSLIAAVGATALLRSRDRHYRKSQDARGIVD